jgi:hypothetical protein
VQLRIQAWVTKAVGQSKINNLRQSTRVLTKSPTHVKSQVCSSTGGLIDMVDNCLVTHNLLRDLLVPSMVWDPLKTKLHMVWDKNPFTETIHIPGVKSQRDRTIHDSTSCKPYVPGRSF